MGKKSDSSKDDEGVWAPHLVLLNAVVGFDW